MRKEADEGFLEKILNARKKKKSRKKGYKPFSAFKRFFTERRMGRYYRNGKERVLKSPTEDESFQAYVLVLEMV